MYKYFSILCFVFFLSCKQAENNTHKIFKYNQASGISTLDPAFAKDQATTWATNQLFDGLVRLDENLNVVPAIADSWQISADGLQYTFFLKKDVFFHEDVCFPNKTRTCTASDFVYSFSRILDKQVASPGSWIFKEYIDTVQPFTAVDSSIFQLRLKKPFIPILNILTMQYCSAVPKEAVEYYKSNFRKHPVGTGPFIFKSWEDAYGMFFTKNNRYFLRDEKGNSLPYLDGVKITFIDQKKTEYFSFVKKQLHFISGADPSYLYDLVDDNGQLKKTFESKYIFYKRPYLNTEYIGILQEDSLLQKTTKALLNKDFRMALNYAIDRASLIKYLKNNIGTAATGGFVPPVLYAKDSAPVGYNYNPTLAKQYFNKSGIRFSENEKLQVTIASTYVDLAEYIVKQWEQIGIPVKLTIQPPDFLRQQVKDGKVPVFRASWIADYADAESYLACFYSKNGSPPNYTHFKNAAFDVLYEQAILEKDFSKRIILYKKMDEIIIQEAPIIPLFYDEVVRFVHKDVIGLEPNAMNLLDLRKVNILH